MVGLKLSLGTGLSFLPIAFNRTMVGLKLKVLSTCVPNSITFNRTMVGLKLEGTPPLEEPIPEPLIALW